MALARSRSTDQSGFSLVEVIVATLVLSVGLIAVAQLFAISTKGNTAARANTFTVILAEQKMEQLRALTWGFDTVGLPVSDFSTDTSNAGTLAGCPAGGSGAATGL